jgi:hypothetical protein
MEQVFETVIYIEFYLAGDCIFSCQKSWLPNKGDIEKKADDLADLHQVPTQLITWAEKEVKLPIILPKELTTDLGISPSR